MGNRALNIPVPWKKDIHKATEILKRGGCQEIFLFGSLASGKSKPGSDLDIAVRGCPPGKFFRLLGELMLELDHPVDLINLDGQRDFAEFLSKRGGLVKIG